LFQQLRAVSFSGKADHCRAIELILDQGRVGEVYNIGGRAEAENLTLVRSLCEVAEQAFARHPELARQFPQCPREQLAGLIRHVADRPGHDRRYAIDCGKIERELGFAPRVGLDEGLRDTFTWFANNAAWWRD
jgi:dTDP-glucose 4,6-dehydratase